MSLKNLLFNLLSLAVFFIVLGIFIYILNDYSFTNISSYITTTIYCDAEDEIRDQLIILQSFHDKLVTPMDGYDIVDDNVFIDMFHNRSGRLGYIQCSDGDTGHWNNGPVVYIMEVNRKIHTVHPYLVDILFEKYRINS